MNTSLVNDTAGMLSGFFAEHFRVIENQNLKN